MGDINARQPLQDFELGMGRCPIAIGPEADAAWLFAGRGDQRGQALPGARGRDGNGTRHRRQKADMGEIAHHIIGHGRQNGRGNALRGDVGQQNGGAIGRAFRNRITAHHAARAGAVFHHHWRAKAGFHLACHQPGQQIRRTTGREGDNEAHRSRGLRTECYARHNKGSSQGRASRQMMHHKFSLILTR